MQLLFFFFAALVLTATTAQTDLDDPVLINNQISLLRRQSGSARKTQSLCLSWRFGVETNNIVGWRTVPEQCQLYVGNYMLGDQYSRDSKVVTKEAYLYAQSLEVSQEGKDIWCFDIDETLLSNLAFYARRGFGGEVVDPGSWDDWILQEDASALKQSLKLYKKLLYLGFKIVLLSERHEDQRPATESNLRIAGYRNWEQLILRKEWDPSGTVAEYKTAQRQYLVDAGYRIIGNVGDQWSDLMEPSAGNRTFKLPNPMYYIA